MSEQTPKNNPIDSDYPEAFPYPRLIQTFDYFFPKEKGAIDILTMENLRKFSRFAPFLTPGLLLITIASCFKNCFSEESFWVGIYLLADFALFLVILGLYLWWLGVSLLAKFVKRSPAIPLVMSFIDPLRIFSILCCIHILGFIFGGLASFAR